MLSLFDQQPQRTGETGATQEAIPEAREAREPGEERRVLQGEASEQGGTVRPIHKECAPSRIANDKCPACGGGSIVLGRYLDQLAGGLLPVFRPRGLKPFTLTGSDVRIPAGDRFCCCVECGHLWSSVKPDQLLQVLQRYGNRQTRERFGSEGWHWLG